MTNRIFETADFTKLFLSLNRKEQEWIIKVSKQLKSNLEVGKPLGFIWFREKKLGNKRLYYLLNFETKCVLFISFGNKKEQQKIIDNTLKNRKKYFKFLNKVNV